ncbi:MAG: hypothetical protein K0S00_3970 [Xanthobacteraceae bacterium]|jgi:hypothetical protein|nr:hypothetical protein [Xanthobacteraceae bacterium]
MTDDNVRPVFVSRKTAAALLEISVDTFDMWVQQGFVPRATINRGQITRWHWPTVEAHLAGPPKLEADPFTLPPGPYVRPSKRGKPQKP